MSEKLKVQIPDGYRWVEVNEKRGDAEWRWAVGGEWRASLYNRCFGQHTIITPIKLQEPEYVDVEISLFACRLVVNDPNGERVANLNDAPCILGPKWAFAGYVWDDGELTDYYHLMVMGEIKYAKVVRFRKVGEVK